MKTLNKYSCWPWIVSTNICLGKNIQFLHLYLKTPNEFTRSLKFLIFPTLLKERIQKGAKAIKLSKAIFYHLVF